MNAVDTSYLVTGGFYESQRVFWLGTELLISQDSFVQSQGYNDSAIQRKESEVSLLIITDGLFNSPPPSWCNSPKWVKASSLPRLHDHTQTHHGHKTPLEKGSARLRNLYLTNHNTHKRQTSMPRLDSTPELAASERAQTHALDRAVTTIRHINL